MRLLALDLECVADADAGRRVFGLTGSDADIRSAMRAKRLEDTEGRSDFVKPAFWQIVAVGMVGLDTTSGAARMHSEAGTTETLALTLVNRWLAKQPRLVTWSGNGFDLAVLRYRAMLHGVSLDGLYGPAGQKSFDSYLYRYGESHIDLMDVLTGYGASTSLKLAEAARLLGLPAKTVTDGSGVEELVEAQDWPSLKTYVLEDALITALLYLRWELTRGRLVQGQFNAALDSFLEAVGPDQFAVRVAIDAWRFGSVPVPA